jgi:hypothetical protein
MLGFLRFLAGLLIVRLVLRLIVSIVRPAPAAAPRPAAAGNDLVRDRVCNTFLPRERALSVVVRGNEQHFCSPACRDRALAIAS